MTLIEIISDIKKVLMASSDTFERIDDVNLKFKVDKYRMDYANKLHAEGYDIPEDYYQQLKLTNISEFKIDPTPGSAETIGITVDLKIPLLGGKEINRISGADRRVQIDYVSPEYFFTLLSIPDDSLKQIEYATIENGKLMFSGGGNTTAIINCISADPIFAYIAAGNTAKNAWNTLRYPVDGTAAFYCFLNILTRDFNLQTRIVADIIKDGQDQFKIERYGKGPTVLQPDVFATPESRGRRANEE